MEGQVRAFLASLEFPSAYSPSTRLAYENDLRCFLEYLHRALGRDPLLNDFNEHRAAEFLHAERQAGRRPSTLLRRRASLRRFASFLRQLAPGWEPAFDVKSPLIEEAISETSPAPIPQSLSSEQVGALWTVLEASPRPRARRDQAILAILLETGLTVGALIAMVAESIEMADADLTRRQLVEARNKGEGLLYSSEKAMEEFGGLLPDSEREFLVVELTECRAALAGDDLMLVQDAVARLEVSAQRIGEAIYAAADAAPDGGS
ncbi:MAG TPA: site-specific integrase [Anaerolineales bacterium]